MKWQTTEKTPLLNEHRLTVIIFSLFFAWILSFPFEGQVLYALADEIMLDTQTLVFTAIAAHCLGLFSCGFFVKNTASAKKVFVWAGGICMAGSAAFYFQLGGASVYLIGLMSFAAALVVASWGFYFKSGTPRGKRIHTAADVLIFSNILMIAVNAAASFGSARLGLGFCIGLLALFLVLSSRLKTAPNLLPGMAPGQGKAMAPVKPLVFLCLFVTVITINSGLMYEVINPAFKHLEALSGWYWAIPYILALIVMRNLSQKADRPYILYAAIAMIGMAFVLFMIMDRSAFSYLTIDTLMLGACGIFDLFWWSILGEMLDLGQNPAQLFGIGLSANVLGVLIGGIVGYVIFSLDPFGINPTIIALVVVFAVLIILPFLNRSLSGVLKDHVYLMRVSDMTASEQANAYGPVFEQYKLTGREGITLLMKGRTYKMIADELCLSENTVKTHLKNAYGKLGIGNKTELVRLFKEY